MKKIDHIGIAVPELEPAVAQYSALGFTLDGIEAVPSQKVKTAFFTIGESLIELLEPSSEDSVIAKFLNKRGPGIHHLCIEVEDLDAAMDDYRKAGVTLVNERPTIGAGGHRVAFIHPKSASGVLLELLERRREPAP